MEQEFRKRENGNEDDLLSFLEEFYRGFGSVMKDSLKNEPKDIRDGVRKRREVDVIGYPHSCSCYISKRFCDMFGSTSRV